MVETHRSRAAAAVVAAAEATMAEETGDAVAGTRDAAVEEGDLTGTGVICASRKVVNTEVEFINIGYRLRAGFPMSMNMLKQASSQLWLSSKSWLLEFEIVVGKKGCEKFPCMLNWKWG